MSSRQCGLILFACLLAALVSLPVYAQQQAPSWAVGTFTGYNKKYAANVELTIRRNGQVIAKNQYDNGKSDTAPGYWRNGQIVFGSAVLNASQISEGIRLVQTNDRANVVRYRRIGGSGGGDQGDNGGNYSPAPSWAVGRFRGHSERSNTTVYLDINRDGRITLRSGNSRQSGGFRNNRSLEIEGTQFRVRQEGSGFRTTQADDPSNQILFQRY